MVREAFQALCFLVTLAWSRLEHAHAAKGATRHVALVVRFMFRLWIKPPSEAAESDLDLSGSAPALMFDGYLGQMAEELGLGDPDQPQIRQLVHLGRVRD